MGGETIRAGRRVGGRRGHRGGGFVVGAAYAVEAGVIGMGIVAGRVIGAGIRIGMGIRIGVGTVVGIGGGRGRKNGGRGNGRRRVMHGAGVIELGVWIHGIGREGAGGLEIARGRVLVRIGVAVGRGVRIAVVIVHGGGGLALFSSHYIFFCRSENVLV